MTHLQCCPDWSKSQERWTAWWNREIVDRPLIQLIGPLKEPRPGAPPAPAPLSLEEQWLSSDYRIAAFEHNYSRTFYLGDAFPFLDTHIGPGTLALYLGSPPTFHPETVWYGKCVDDIPSAVPPRFDQGNRFWQASLEMARKGVERLRGRAYVSFPDLIEGLDTIASLFGTDELLMALVDYPDKVHEFQRAVTDLYFEYYDRLYEIIKDDEGGSVFSAFCVYGPGRIAKVQCDFSAMISAQMFEGFVVPYLAEQCKRLDHSVFHLDGPCCLQHLDLLCAIEPLDAIQWTPGAGQPGVGHEMWWPIYKRIRAAGKSLMLNGVTPAEAEALAGEFGPEGLDLLMWVESEEVAQEVLRQSQTWRRRR